MQAILKINLSISFGFWQYQGTVQWTEAMNANYLLKCQYDI